jgi:hypothetical protein
MHPNGSGAGLVRFGLRPEGTERKRSGLVGCHGRRLDRRRSSDAFEANGLLKKDRCSDRVVPLSFGRMEWPGDAAFAGGLPRPSGMVSLLILGKDAAASAEG